MVAGQHPGSYPSSAPGLGFSGVSCAADRLRAAATVEELATCLSAVARDLGFPFHALVHHADQNRPPPQFMFLQNYPKRWVETYAHRGLYRHDPARRLASVRPASFIWADLESLMPLSGTERRTLEQGRHAGLAGGFTIPLHTAGERPASCSFAIETGQSLPSEILAAAEYVAHVAFGALFDLLHPRRALEAPRLTRRQEECVDLLARGKTDWEIGAILGLTEGTVSQYLKAARHRFGVTRRTQLAMAAASFGLVGFDEVASWQYSSSGI